MAVSVVSFRIEEDPPARLDKALSRDVPDEAALSRSRLGKIGRASCRERVYVLV